MTTDLFATIVDYPDDKSDSKKDMNPLKNIAEIYTVDRIIHPTERRRYIADE